MNVNQKIFSSIYMNNLLRSLTGVGLLLLSVPAAAQYYYKDILVVEQTNLMQKRYAGEKIKKVTLQSYDADNTTTRDFLGYQLVGDNFRKLTTITRTSYSDFSTMTSLFDESGRLSQVTDSTNSNVGITSYSYTPVGLPEKISVKTRSLRNQYEQLEEHLWQYNSSSLPVQMLRIRNGKDTLRVTFVVDEKGKVAEEKTVISPRRSESVYYYYTPEGKLSDIVRYNIKAKRLLPEFMFEYNENGFVSKMINVPNAGGNYVTWLYVYDKAGLKQREVAQDKQKQLMGRVDYLYER